MKYTLKIWTSERAYLQKGFDSSYKAGDLKELIKKRGEYGMKDDDKFIIIPYHSIEKFEIVPETPDPGQ